MSYYHDLTHAPVGLWQLNESLADSSGNGNTLSVLNGTARYCELYPDLRGFHFDGLTRLGLSSFVAALAITGAWTFECIWLMGSTTTDVNGRLIEHSAPGDTQATNYLYLVSTAGVPRALSYLHEVNAGADRNHTGVAQALGHGYPVHIAVTRSATGVVKFYINGQLYETTSALGLPNGGDSGRFMLGASNANTEHCKGGMASVKIMNIELSDADVLAEFGRTLGNIHGRI